MAHLTAPWRASGAFRRARHKPHITPALTVLRAEGERQGARTLVDWLEDVVDRAAQLPTAAEQAGNVHQALAAVREVRASLETLGNVSGQLKPKGQVTVVNVLASSEWIETRSRLLVTLAPFPEAQVAVAGALNGKHQEAVDDVVG